jgi:hypothetical protein
MVINRMNKPNGGAPDAEEVFMQSKKTAYNSPELKVYGSVSKWTMGTRTMNNDGTNTRKKASDRGPKENIVQVGRHPLGIGLYLFDYKPEYRKQWGSGRQFGVMADEVEAVMPQAVSVHPAGYKMVDYALLGVNVSDC